MDADGTPTTQQFLFPRRTTRAIIVTRKTGTNRLNPHTLVVELSTELEGLCAALRKDYSSLSSRIRTLEHRVSCGCNGVTLRLHFPSFRQGKPTVSDLIQTIATFLPPFALPRSEINAVTKLYGSIDVDAYNAKVTQLYQSAVTLFIRANRATNRNGEAGELLLYLLTEWILAAPQILAKMSLKTNRDMPVHGADGIHIGYNSTNGALLIYWGESKLYADVNQAINAAIDSVCAASDPEKTQHELSLIQRNIDFAGLTESAKRALLRYLDPFDEASNHWEGIPTCLIGFDFSGFQKAAQAKNNAEATFQQLAEEHLKTLSPTITTKLTAAGLDDQTIELFFFPLPSVQRFRDVFQKHIGWK
ncbi:DUF1837 domain-containing protein [Rhodopseudomonas palustris]|uniref:HamA C-terminal domain-containing protein n=1 Tax=Rhodopseudomonas palustris TaxID=1076 RepID=UPI002FDCE621